MFLPSSWQPFARWLQAPIWHFRGWPRGIIWRYREANAKRTYFQCACSYSPFSIYTKTQCCYRALLFWAHLATFDLWDRSGLWSDSRIQILMLQSKEEIYGEMELALCGGSLWKYVTSPLFVPSIARSCWILLLSSNSLEYKGSGQQIFFFFKYITTLWHTVLLLCLFMLASFPTCCSSWEYCFKNKLPKTFLMLPIPEHHQFCWDWTAFLFSCMTILCRLI